jgi:hypothetical protein
MSASIELYLIDLTVATVLLMEFYIIMYYFIFWHQYQ